MKVTTVLGESREATRFYGDGSVDCPFCSNAIMTPGTECQNPWCDAHPSWNPDKLQARLDERIERDRERKADEERRISVTAMARESRAAHVAWEQEQMAEARRRGACLRCLFAPGWERVRFVKHRVPCPKS